MTDSQPQYDFRLLRLALLLALLSVVTGSMAGQPRLVPGEAIDAIEAESYNIWITLEPADGKPKGASVALIFARQDDGFYAVVFASNGTTLLHSARGKTRRLAQGPSAIREGNPVEVLIKRRPVRIAIEAQGETLLEAWDASCHAGEISLAPGARGIEVADVLAQPVAPVLFTDDFLAEAERGELWEGLSGSWEIESYHDPVRALDRPLPQASWYTGQGLNAVSLTGDEFWEDYRLEVSALARRDTWMGLACFADLEGHTRFAVLPGADQARAGLFRVREGQTRLLAEAPVTCAPDLWHRLALEATGTDIRAFIDEELVLSAPSAGTASGRAGLFASGPEKIEFDDFTAQGMDSFTDHFAGRLNGRWEMAGGRWQLARGKLSGTAASDALALVAHRTWRDASIDVTLAGDAQASAGPVLRFQDEQNYYALLASGDTWQLTKMDNGEQVSLAEGSLPESESPRLGMLARGPQIIVHADGRELGRAYDFAFEEGRAGFLVRGRGKAAIEDFAVRAASREPATTVSFVRCEGETLPGPEHGKFLPAIGYLWRPNTRAWALQTLPGGNRALRGVARSDRPSIITYRQVAPGSVMLSAAIPVAPEGDGGIAICTDGRDSSTGYAIALSPGPRPSAKLLRQGQTIAELDPPEAEGPPWPGTLTIFRDGPVIGASLGDSHVTYTDPDPLPDGRPALWVNSGQVTFDDLRLANLRATVDLLNRPAPEWVSSHGSWRVYSGMACIESDYWTTVVGKPLALAWRREPRPADFVLDFNVSEYSEGYESGAHKHFPYHDISIAFSGDGTDPDSGYRLVIGADRGRSTKLLRQGKVVAQNDDRRFRIYMSRHCNVPRAFDARVEKRGAHINLSLNGTPAIQFTDPEPLGPGQIGIGVANCTADFRDVVLYSWP